MKKRLFAIILALAMVLSLVPAQAFATDGAVDEHDHDHEVTRAAETKAAKTGTVLAFTSDIHNDENNTANNRMAGWIDAVVRAYGGIDIFAFGGDMATNSANGDNFWTYSQKVMTTVESTTEGKGLVGAYTTGNHEYSNGQFSSTSNSVKGKYTIDGEVVNGKDYRIYCLGSSSSSQSYTYSASDSTTSPTTQVGKLAKFLSEVGNDKPIFIITHFPLHVYSSRTTSNADKVIDALNTAVFGTDGIEGTSDDKTIIFLWGHNHSQKDGAYDQIYSPGYELNYSGSSKKSIKFYYAAAGCMSDTEYVGSSSVKGKGLVVKFDKNDSGDLTLDLVYLDGSGNQLSESTTNYPNRKTITVELPDIPATAVTIDEATAAGDDQPVTVAKGSTLQLHVSFEPANSNSSVSWTSSNEAVATVDDNGLVTGLATGTTTITATVIDSAKREVIKAELDVTVGTAFVLTDTLVGGKEYLIATNNNGNLYVLNSSMAGLAKEAVNGEIAVTDEEAATTVFSCILADSSNAYSTQLKLGEEGYLYAASGNNGAFAFGLNTEPGDGKYWHYITNDGTQEKDLLWFFQDAKDTTTGSHGYSWAGSTYRYYLNYSDEGVFSKGQLESTSVSLADTETPKIYLFVKADDTYVDATGITLNESALSIGTGQSETLTATVAPNTATTKQVLWTSSNSNIAKVDYGVVTGVAEGTATITATTVNGQGIATCTVTVTRSDVPRYELATSLEDGEEYLIVSANSISGYALKNPGTSGTNIANSSYKTAVTINTGSIAYIEIADSDIIWTAAANGSGFNLSNNGLYLEGVSSNVSVYSTLQNAGRYWTYDGDNHYLQHKGGSNTYNLRYSSSRNYFQGSTSNTGAVYLFKKVTEQVDVTGVTVDPATKTIVVGEEATLTASVAPQNATNKTVTWSSSDESKVTVDQNGKITGVAAGTATITATSNNGIAGTCVVTVNTVAVTGVELNKETATVEIGKSLTLTATVKPDNATNKNVSWSSSDSNKATVDQTGKVTGIAEGSVTITVTTADGNKIATCNVTVTQPVVRPGYVIVIDGYAMKAEAEPDSVYHPESNDTNKYYGLKGVEYTDALAAAPTDDILWVLTPVEGETTKYYIQSMDGKYLGATYKSDEPYEGRLLLEDNWEEHDIWILDGSLEDWVVSEIKIQSTNASTSSKELCLAYETVGPNSSSIHLFTVRSRSNADASSIESPDITVGGVRYEETDALADGKEYIIGVTSDSNHVYAVKNVATGTSSTNTGSVTLEVKQDGGTNYIETEDTGVPWKYTSSNKYLTNGSFYLYLYSRGNYVPRATTTSSNAQAVTYDGKLQIGTRYLTCSSGTFGSTTTKNSGADIRLFEKRASVTYAIKWVGADGTILKTDNLAMGATPAYTGETPTKASDDQYDYNFIGWSPEVTVVTGLAVYTAQFEAIPKTTHTHTFGEPTFNWVEVKDDNDVVTGYACDTATFTCTDPDCDQSEGYTFNVNVTLNHSTTAEPSCTGTGVETYNASFTYNDQDYSDSKTVTLAALGHNMTHHDAVPATCTQTGTVEYYSCSRCEKNFSDEAGTTELESIVEQALGHQMTPHEAVASTCTVAGNSAYYECTRCHKYFSDAEGENEIEANSWILPLADHTWGEWSVTTPATCTEAGEKTRACSVCNTTSTEAIPIDENAHSWGTASYVWAQDNSTVTASRICEHNADHVDSETVNTTPETTDATCTVGGTVIYTAEFTNSAFETQTKTVTGDPLGHNMTAYPAVASTCTVAGNSAYWYCERCHKYFSDADGNNEITESSWILPLAAHTLVAHEATAATCSATGNTAYWECSACHALFSDEAGTTATTIEAVTLPIDPNAHSWNDPTWTWNDAHTQATATFVCDHNAAHTDSVSTDVITSAAGEGEHIGYTAYTATVTFNNTTYTSDPEYVINQYTITFLANEGDTEPYATITKNYGEAITDADKPADPEKAFYTFNGWNAQIPATMPVDGMTITAQWTAVEAYYLIGSLTDTWQVLEAYQFAEGTAAGEYILTTTLAAGDEIKVVRAVGGVAQNQDYYPSTEHNYNGKTNNYTVDLDHAGSVTVYFRPNGNSDGGWAQFGGYFYIEKAHEATVTVPDGHGSAVLSSDSDEGVTISASRFMTITITCTPDEGYGLDRIELWKTHGGTEDDKIVLTGTTFDMPDYDVTVKVYFRQFVAKIGDTGYFTLQDAMDAAADGDTIVLVASTTAPEYVNVLKKVTLDLNGKNFKGVLTVTKLYEGNAANGDLTIKDSVGGGLIEGDSPLVISDGGAVTLKSGTILTDTEAAAVWLENGSFTITGGTVRGMISDFRSSVNAEPSTIVIEGGVITSEDYQSNDKAAIVLGKHTSVSMTGGSIEGHIGIRYAYSDSPASSVSISGGTIDVSGYGILLDSDTAGNLVVTGGTIISGQGVIYVRSGATLNRGISGGIFNQVVPEDYIVEGYECIPYTAIEGYYTVAKIGHEHDDIDFQPWAGADSLPTEAGIYYLTKDVTLSETWNVPEGTVTLCLNGHTISLASGATGSVINVPEGSTFNLYDCKDEGTVTGGNAVNSNGGGVKVNGTFNMNGGSISSNSASSGGGVYVSETGNFTLNAGTISGNNATYGGGVFVQGVFNMNGGSIENNAGNDFGNYGAVYMFSGSSPKDGGPGWDVYPGEFHMNGGTISNNAACGVYAFTGTFTMDGGSITNNTVGGITISSQARVILEGGSITGNTSTSVGAGVYVYYSNDNALTVSGNPVISGNTVNGEEDNVYLRYFPTANKNGRINVSGALTEGAHIGVTMESAPTDEAPVVFTSGYNTHNSADPSEYFYSDNSAYTVTLSDNGEAQLSILHTHDEIVFRAWTSADSLPTAAGNYYLAKDVTLSSAWTVPEGTVNLCLNGHTVNAGNWHIAVNEGSTLNLYDHTENEGAMTGNVVVVNINTGGTFNMYGGSIIGCNGIAVTNNGSFHMDGGSIAGNGFGVMSIGSTYVSGNAVISGNTNGNVVLYANGKIVVEGDLTTDALIGVKLNDQSNGDPIVVTCAAPYAFTSGLSGKGVLINFVSDNGYSLRINADGEAEAYIDHTFADPDVINYTWATDNSTCTASHTCTACGQDIIIEAVNSTSVATDPTCTEAGYTTYSADFTDPALVDQNKVVPGAEAIGHNYGAPSYEWSEDHNTCTATRVCANNSEHTETEIANSTSVVTAPTCTEAGYTTYTATFANTAFAEQTEVVPGAAATGHTYGAPAWNWTGSDEAGWTAATATFTCTKCVEGTEGHSVTKDATVERTDGEDPYVGYDIYTASVEFNGRTYTDVKRVIKRFTVTFNMMGHGTQIPAQTVEYGNNIEYVVPTAEGWVFKSWHTDESLSSDTIWYGGNSSSYRVTQDMTLYAKWIEKPTAVITFTDTEVIYNGDGQMPTVTVTAEGMPNNGVIAWNQYTIYYYSDEGCTDLLGIDSDYSSSTMNPDGLTVFRPTDAGTYYVKVVVPDRSDANWKYYGSEAVGTFTITKRSIVIIPTYTEVTYNGEYQHVSGYTFGGDGFAAGQDVNSGVGTIGKRDAGEYSTGLINYQYAKVFDSTNSKYVTENYVFTCNEDEIVLKITPAPLTITAVEKVYPYSGNAQGPAGTYTSGFGTYVTLSADGLVGGDTLKSITIAGSKTDAGVYENEIVPSGAAFNYNHTLDVEDPQNYAITYVNATLTINKAATNNANVTLEGWTYGDTPNTPATTADFGADTATYSYSTTEDGEYAAAVPTEPGTYFVKATIAGTDNYVGATATASFEISKTGQAAPEVEHTDETISGKNDGTITRVTTAMEYSTDGETWTAITADMLTEGALTGLAPGTYYVRYAETDTASASPATEIVIAASETKLTITFVDEDGTSVLGTQNVSYGQTPVYGGDAPTKDPDADYHYTFDGWDPALAPATANKTYTATYTAEAHSWGEWVVTTPATPTEPGEETRTCSHCGRTETRPVAATGHTITGTVISFSSNDPNEDGIVTLTLTAEGAEEPAHTTTAVGNEAEYTFTGVEPGTYTMKVSKDHHVTRTYAMAVAQDGTVTITEDGVEATQVKIHLLGDIDGNGQVTTRDFGMANAQAQLVGQLSGYYLACADLDGNGVVSTREAGMINAHAQLVLSLWYNAPGE